jgi:hypothetical protein
MADTSKPMVPPCSRPAPPARRQSPERPIRWRLDSPPPRGCRSPAPIAPRSLAGYLAAPMATPDPLSRADHRNDHPANGHASQLEQARRAMSMIHSTTCDFPATGTALAQTLISAVRGRTAAHGQRRLRQRDLKKAAENLIMTVSCGPGDRVFWFKQVVIFAGPGGMRGSVKASPSCQIHQRSGSSRATQ